MLMQLILFLAAATLSLCLLRSCWRMLVEIPDRRQVWAPDVIDGFLSRSISFTLMVNCALFLVAVAKGLG